MGMFGSDMMIDNFKLSDYGMMLASFDSGAANSEEELGMDQETVEEYVGQNPVPVYLGSKHTNKLRPQATIVKNPCYTDHIYFTEHECREILRQLTGFRGYRSMQIYPFEFDELLYFRVRVTGVSCRKISGKVAGILLQMECDSQFAWSKEFHISYNIKADEVIRVYNTSDDLYNYLLPEVTITSPASVSSLELTNLSDHNWTTVISNISKNEIITMDSRNEILTSSNTGRIVMNDFNMHFIRMVSGENQIRSNSNLTLAFRFRVPRKAGFL